MVQEVQLVRCFLLVPLVPKHLAVQVVLTVQKDQAAQYLRYPRLYQLFPVLPSDQRILVAQVDLVAQLDLLVR